MSEYAVEAKYTERYGYEEVACEESLEEGIEQLNCYRNNMPQYPHRLVRVYDDGDREVLDY